MSTVATNNVLDIKSLGLTLAGPHDSTVLLRDVSLSIAPGESVGLVGESGSGKSLTARSVVGLQPDGSTRTGSILLNGVDFDTMSVAERRVRRGTDLAMIFQDPRAHINPVRRIGDHLTEALRYVQKVDAATARSRAVELLGAVNIDRPEHVLRMYPHELSGGMLQRVMIAGALTCSPQLLLADEPTTALDMTTQAEVMGILADLQESRGMAILFITHDLELAAATCDRTVVMYAGSIMEERRSKDLQTHPLHPYSSALLRSRPSLTIRQERLATIPGRPVTADEIKDGCPFASRCDFVEPECQVGHVPLVSYVDGRVACRLADELSLSGSGGSR